MVEPTLSRLPPLEEHHLVEKDAMVRPPMEDEPLPPMGEHLLTKNDGTTLPPMGEVSNTDTAIAFSLGFEEGVRRALEMVSEAIQNVQRPSDPFDNESVSIALSDDLSMVLDIVEDVLLEEASS